MRKEDSLHQLILSLDSSEKRLFKIFANNSNSKKSNYIELFDVISKMIDYNETLLKKKIKNKNTLKNLAQAKKYLKELILKSMCEHDEKTPEDEVNELLKQVSFLSKKNLFNEKWKKLKKAKEIADKYELFNLSLNILDRQMSYKIEQKFDESLKFFNEYDKNKNDLTNKILMVSKISSFKSKIFQTYRQNKSNVSDSLKNELKSELDILYNDKMKPKECFKFNSLYYISKSILFEIFNDKKLVFKNRKNIIEQYDLFSHFKNNQNYLVHYFNYIGSIVNIGDFKLLKKELDYIESFNLKNTNNQGEFFQNIVLHKLLYFMNTGLLNDAKKMNDIVLKGLKKYKNKVNASSLLTISYNYSLIYFLNDDFNGALNWIDKIDKIKSDVRKDILSFSQILRIICHLELGNNSLVEPFTRSFIRKMNYTEFEKKLANKIFAISKSVKSDQVKTLHEIKDLITYYQNQKIRITGKDILGLWLNSKLEKTSLFSKYSELLSS